MTDSETERPRAETGSRRTPRSRIGFAGKLLLPLLILGGAVAFAGYLRATRPPVDRTSVQERVWTVSAVPVAVTEEQPELRLFGEVVAGREVELRPLVSGRIVEVGPNFVDGGVVGVGELLIAVDPFDYEARVEENSARLAEVQAKIVEYTSDIAAEKRLKDRDRELVSLRERDVKRRKQLRARGTGSQKALDDSRLALNEQRQRLIGRDQSIGRLAARIDQQRAVERRFEVSVARARRNLEETRLLAPFDAFLVDTNIAIGKMVGTGDRVARLIDSRWLEVRFQMSNDQFARLIGDGNLRGRAARVLWRTGTKEFAFAAVIDRISSEIDAASGGVDLFARIADAGPDSVLRPGAFVEIRVAGRLYRNVVRLPDSALHGGDTVYAIVEEGRLAARKVEVVARAGNDVLVRGEFAATDRIVTTAFAEIGPGVRVEVR